MSYRKIILGLCLFLPILSATADDSVEPDAYVSAVGFYAEPDEDRGAEEGVGIQLSYGKLLSGNWFMEGTLAATNFETDNNGGTDFYHTTLGLDLAYRFNGMQGFTPFVLAGGGVVYNDVFPDNDDSTDFYANAGVGFVSDELGSSGLHLRGDARYIYDDFQDGMSDWRVGLGFEVPLGGKRVITKEVVVEKTVMADTADSDNDGVVDGVDRCPKTLAGALVDQFGCVVAQQTIRLEGVNFDFDSANLTAESVDILGRVVESLSNQPKLEVEIAGHTDALGSDAYNQSLSQQRTESVRKHLVSKGIDPARLTANGYGESQPVASNDTAEGRALNRRVEFRVKGTQ